MTFPAVGKIHLRTFAVWNLFLLLCLYCCCVVNNINHVLIRHSNHKFNSRYSRGIGHILLILHKQNHNGKVQTSRPVVHFPMIPEIVNTMMMIGCASIHLFPAT